MSLPCKGDILAHSTNSNLADALYEAFDALIPGIFKTIRLVRLQHNASRPKTIFSFTFIISITIDSITKVFNTDVLLPFALYVLPTFPVHISSRMVPDPVLVCLVFFVDMIHRWHHQVPLRT
ncbi:hypothetical protein CRM22_008130 [Opisthorchis felineus]|uniref:Uncharacterized protein n=1 Tax=Opisthorchis felineus TaxID=147828 RepID=A0A4S2LJM4_OPIFE|nr:hypothetical protein CRM22_008130 [Opisthorchis felineus]TGZ61170.1 hypothetical protein CRM22_008130 [Opisthorchis felineus]TGZ61172.1 hypothetical protein CRM22_008130 [Opisthorchis felineus]